MAVVPHEWKLAIPLGRIFITPGAGFAVMAVSGFSVVLVQHFVSGLADKHLSLRVFRQCKMLRGNYSVRTYHFASVTIHFNIFLERFFHLAC